MTFSVYPTLLTIYSLNSSYGRLAIRWEPANLTKGEPSPWCSIAGTPSTGEIKLEGEVENNSWNPGVAKTPCTSAETISRLQLHLPYQIWEHFRVSEPGCVLWPHPNSQLHQSQICTPAFSSLLLRAHRDENLRARAGREWWHVPDGTYPPPWNTGLLSLDVSLSFCPFWSSAKANRLA